MAVFLVFSRLRDGSAYQNLATDSRGGNYGSEAVIENLN